MKKVIIIGAGPAGLTAAYALQKESDIQPIILEADEVVGGLSRTVNFGGNRMDIGGHRFFTKCPEVQALWEEILPYASAPAFDDRLLERETETRADGADPETADAVFLNRQRISRILYLHKCFDYPVSLSLSTIRNLGFARMCGIGASYFASCVHKREEKTLEDFMVNRFGRRLYETFFEGYTEKVWGRSPRRIGADWGSQRIRGISLGAVLADFFSRALHLHPKKVETSLIERFSYPKHGPGQFYECLAEEVRRRGGDIRFGCRVEQLIGGADGRIEAVVYRAPDGSRQRLAADAVLSSMPVKDLCAALPEDWLSAEVRETAAALPYRDFMTAGLLVDRLELVNETAHKTLGNIVPDCWIYVQEPEVQLGRLQIFNNWSPYLVRDPLHTVWIGLEYFCQEGDALWSMDDAAFLRFAEEELTRIGVIRPGAVREGHVVRMQKAYPAYYGSYRDFPAVRAALDRVPNLYCIGRNGQHRYNNMDHSMLTGLRAAELLRAGSEDKTALWEVNTEQAYQETQEAAE